jgi:hypothetical protein
MTSTAPPRTLQYVGHWQSAAVHLSLYNYNPPVISSGWKNKRIQFFTDNRHRPFWQMFFDTDSF